MTIKLCNCWEKLKLVITVGVGYLLGNWFGVLHGMQA